MKSKIIELFTNYPKAILFMIALAIRMIVALNSYHNEVWISFADDLAREKYSNTIINKGLIFEVTNYKSPESVFAPGIPIVLALKTLVFGNTWLPVFILNAIIGALTCLIIYLISLQFFSINISLLAYAWAALYPNFIRYIETGGNEPWSVLLFALTFLFAVKAINSQKINYNIILYSIFFTLLFHFDERYITYSLLFSVFLLLGQDLIRVKLKKVVLFALLTLMFSLPWLIRNYKVYNDIVLISCRTNNITDPIFNHRRELMFFDHTPDNKYLSPAQIDSIHKGLLTTFSNGKPIYKGQLEAMKSGNIPHSFTTSEKIFSRIYFLWVPLKFKDNYRITGYEFNPSWSLIHNLLNGLSYGLLLPFVLSGLFIILFQRRWKELILFSSILIYHTFIHVAFIPYTRDRYRHPIDFILIILGCYGICITYSFLKTSFNSSKELKQTFEKNNVR